MSKFRISAMYLNFTHLIKAYRSKHLNFLIIYLFKQIAFAQKDLPFTSYCLYNFPQPFVLLQSFLLLLFFVFLLFFFENIAEYLKVFKWCSNDNWRILRKLSIEYGRRPCSDTYTDWHYQILIRKSILIV